MAEFGDTGFYRHFQLLEVSDISLLGEDSPIESLDLPNRLNQVTLPRHGIWHRANLSAQIYGDDVGALLSKAQCVRTALASGSSSNECDFTFEA
jgi:hypothetical protein